MNINNKIKFLCSLITEGKGIADVGTDHGQLAIELATTGYKGNIFATDIREQPLNNAINSAIKHGVRDKINFIRCDGLQNVPPKEIDTIVCAGIGGETITGILDRDYWCAAPGYRLFLQPMTMEHVLRYWLINNEFKIIHEYLFEDGNFIYTIVEAIYGKSRLLSDAELFVGDLNLIRANPLFDRKVDQEIQKLSTKIHGLSKSESHDSAASFSFFKSIVQELHEIKKGEQ